MVISLPFALSRGTSWHQPREQVWYGFKNGSALVEHKISASSRGRDGDVRQELTAAKEKAPSLAGLSNAG
jgi:hypothetical protein